MCIKNLSSIGRELHQLKEKLEAAEAQLEREVYLIFLYFRCHIYSILYIIKI